MAQPFDLHHDATVGATPEQVWDAITDGGQLDSWFMGRNDIEPRVGGRATMAFSSFTIESTVTAWQPPTRLELRTEEADDGSFHNFEYVVESTERGSAIRWNHSGALGDDWEAEYAGMSEGDPMYLHKLVEYLTYFPGKVATSIDGIAPPPPAGDPTWEIFLGPLGLPAAPELDASVRLVPDGLDAIEGVVDYRSPSFFGVRTDDAMYRFIRGFEGSVLIGHHLFADDVDASAVQDAWRTWLAREFS